MKKFLLSLLAMFAVMAVNAAEVTVTPGEGLWSTGSNADYGGAGFEFTDPDGIVFVGLYKGGSSSDIIEPTAQIRHYKNSTLIIHSTAGENIVNVVFTCTGGSRYCNDLTINGDVVTADTESMTVTWSGNASIIVADATSGQNRYSSIVITTTDGGQVALAVPTFSPKAGTYYETQNVTISAAEGATIYYTTEGTTPTTSSSVYSTPIEVAQSMTIKAIATLDGETSDVATAEYVISSYTPVASIAEFHATDQGTMVEFSNPVTAVFQGGNYLYITDGTDITLVYGSTGQTYNNGDVIPAGFTGRRDVNQDIPQLASPADFAASASTTDAVAPESVAVGDVTADMYHQYLKLEGVTVTVDENTYYYATSGNDQLRLYSRFSTAVSNDDLAAAAAAGTTYTVEGFVSQYSGAVQLFPSALTSSSGETPEPEPEPTDGVIFNETCADNDGGFTVQNITKPEEMNNVWYYSSGYGNWNASGFFNGTNNEAEGWLISPEIDLTGYTDVKLQMDVACGYLNNGTLSDHIQIKMVAASGYTGDVTTTSWTNLEATNWPAGTSASAFSTLAPISLAQFEGAPIRLAMRYASTTECAPTMRFKNFIITGTKSSGVEGIIAKGGVKAIGLDGQIAIVGESSRVEVYTIGGAIVAKGNLKSISCPAGAYIVKIDGKAAKVIVK